MKSVFEKVVLFFTKYLLPALHAIIHGVCKKRKEKQIKENSVGGKEEPPKGGQL